MAVPKLTNALVESDLSLFIGGRRIVIGTSRTTGGGSRVHCSRPTAVARSTADPASNLSSI